MGSPVFKRGITRAIFISLGKVPVVTDKFSTCVSGLRIVLSADFIIVADTESQPGLLDFRFSINECTSFSTTGAINMLLELLGPMLSSGDFFISGILLASVGPMFTK